MQHSRQQWNLARCFAQHVLLQTRGLPSTHTRAFAAIPETSVGNAEQAIEGAAQLRGEVDSPRHRWFPGAVLKQFGRDLTDQARRGLLDPVIGRDAVIQRALQVILRRAKNNPCLIGDAGVGKTAIVEGIAQLMVSQQVPPGLAGKRLIALDVTGLVAGSAYRGEFESRLKGLLKDVADARNVILFIDEMHMLMGAGASEGGLDASNILKPALARGGLLQCIGATTVEEWRQHIEPDAAFTRRWQPIMVQEPSLEAALACLQGLRPRYEAHHGVVITDDALKAAVRCAKRHITDRRLPDSAIDMMDESAARCLLKSSMETMEAAKACEANAAATAAATAQASAINSSPQAHQLTPLSPSPGPPQAAPSRGPHTVDASSYASIRAESVGGRRDSTRQQSSPSQEGGGSGSSSSSSSSSNLSADRSSATQGESAGPGAGRSRPITDWHSWVARHGWQGHTEHERQKLLEWFGATPENPEPGSEGHRQTTAKRNFYRLVLEGAAPEHAAQESVHISQAVAGGGGEASSSVSSAFGSSVPVGVRRLEVLPHAFNKSKACPQCGFLCDVKQSKLSDDGLRLRCPSCRTSFLNIPPEKLLMGTSTFQTEPPFFHAQTDTNANASTQATQLGQQGASHHSVHSAQGTPHASSNCAATTHSNDQGPWREDMDNAHGPQLEPWLSQAAQQQQQQPLQQQQQQPQSAGATRVTSVAAPHIQVAPMLPDIQRLQAARQQQQAKAEAFARPFPIHCVVDEQDVLETVTESTGVPVTAMDSQAAHHLMDLEQMLAKVVLGQSAAVRAVASAVRMWRMGLLQSDYRPAASFVFRGPPGVGKSLMCKELARHVMGDEQALLRFQMSEYTDRASLARLIGAPPGYVGYGRSTGTLVDAVRRRPHCVLVLEDVDKAHPEVQEVLLRIVDEGSLSDSQGRRASFESAFVVFTLSDRSVYRTGAAWQSSSRSQHEQQQHQQQQQPQHELEPAAQPRVLHSGSATNEQMGADNSGGDDAGQMGDSEDASPQGGGHSSTAANTMSGAMSSSSSSSSKGGGGSRGPHAQHGLSPTVVQLLSLVDATVDFAPLGREQLARIVEAQLAEVAAQFSRADVALGSGAAGVALEVDDAARAFLVDQVEIGRAGLPGAQHVRSLIRTHVMGPVAELLLLHTQQQQQQQQQETKSSDSTPVIKVSYERQDSSSTGEGAAAGSTGRLVFNVVE